MDGGAEQTAADPIDGAPAGREAPELNDEPERKRGEYFVQSVERALAVIRTFSADHRDRPRSETARHPGMTGAAARRFVLTLADLGYLGVLDRKFYLRPTVLELGHTYLSVRRCPR